MRENTLYLPGFSSRLCGRQGENEARRLREKARRLDGLSAVVARFIPLTVFAKAKGTRDRVFTPWITFCAFLSQVLQRGASCRDAVKWVQALYLAEGAGGTVDNNTSGYCQARNRLPLDMLKKAFTLVAQWCATRPRAADLWQGRIVKIVDGCGISMPDTPANRAVYKYASGQKPGCGFPTGQLLGLFNLCTGHLVRFVLTSWQLHEAPLARQLLGWVNKGEVLLADRAFSSWELIALFQGKGVDVVMRLHQGRKAKPGRQTWFKPQLKKQMEQVDWDKLPKNIEVRVLSFRCEIPGFRTDVITLVTTLLDEVAYPDSALADLFRRRWQIEVSFRDIKTSLGLDVLRTKTPELIEKEIHLQAIAYNLIRAMMLDAAKQHNMQPSRLSFKGTLSTLHSFAHLFDSTRKNTTQRYSELLLSIATDPVPLRPNRSEPRAVKRRPKPYQLLTKPRREMVVSTSRRRKSPITPVN